MRALFDFGRLSVEIRIANLYLTTKQVEFYTMKTIALLQGWICFVGIVACSLNSHWASAETPEDVMDGVYTSSRTCMNEEGEEQAFFPYDWTILELHQGQFRYWFYSDCITPGKKNPVTGTFAKQGDLVVLDHEEFPSGSKRYVAKTIKGVFGLWTEKGLKEWQTGVQVIWPAMLVRVADSPYAKDIPDSIESWDPPKDFTYPSIQSLFDAEAVNKYWAKEKEKHEARYNDIPEPLRTLLREKTRRDDGDLVHYKQAIERIQKNLDPILIKQLVKTMGRGQHQVTSPQVLKDIFLPSSLLPDQPAFQKDDQSRLQALTILVDSMQYARDQQALQPMLLVFLEASGVNTMKLEAGDGQTIKISKKDGTSSYNSFNFTPEIRSECQAWAQSQLAAPDRQSE